MLLVHKILLSFQPIRFETKTKRDLAIGVFPTYGQFAYFYFVFSLAAHYDIFQHSRSQIDLGTMNEKPPLLIERISREGRKAKANKSQKPIKGNEKITRSQWERRLKISKLPEAMENVSDQVTIGFRFDSDWLLGWREFPGPITERCKPKQPRNIFDSQVEIFLCITA